MNKKEAEAKRFTSEDRDVTIRKSSKNIKKNLPKKK